MSLDLVFGKMLETIYRLSQQVEELEKQVQHLDKRVVALEAQARACEERDRARKQLLGDVADQVLKPWAENLARMDEEDRP